MRLFIILIFISLNLFANTESEFQRRVNLYGLNDYTNQVSQYDEKIITSLKNDIFNSFIPDTQEILGKCDDINCLISENNYLALKVTNDKICLPFTTCEFYHCMEDKYQCEREGVNYFTKLAYPTCKQYLHNISGKKFTQKGHDWIYSVMVCLQKGLVEECEIKKNCIKESPKETCNYITEFTLKFHPGCYLNSGVGICKLPIKDKINIWKTVAPFLTPREKEEAYKVIMSCITGGF